VTFAVSNPSGIRSFLTTIVYTPIYNLFVALLTFLPGHSLGWAIVIITLIVRLILLVPQHHMLESQRKLQVIQPRIKELQKKYKDDQSKLGMEMLELYKKEKVNPMGSCLPLIIQMPILIGLYWVISGISDPSNFYHLYDFFQTFDPTKIDAHFL
jgi:YidC/Oxa1 family membrane protein insertase